MESLLKEKELTSEHESLGKVVKVRGKVKPLKPGNPVVATFRKPDDCINCRAEEYDMCLKGKLPGKGN